MSIHEYQREFVDGGWNVESVRLRNAIRGAFPGMPFRTLIPGDDPTLVRVTFDADLDAAQVALLNATYVQDKADTDPLEPLRARLIKMVDTNSRALIAEGFEWPAASGQIFSQSLAAQANFNTLTKLASDGMPGLFPLPRSFIDDSGEIELGDAADLAGWGGAGIARRFEILLAGGVLKAQLRAMTAFTQLNAFKDVRT